MTNDYNVPLDELSAIERERYQTGMRLIACRDFNGLEIVLNVLENSRPFHSGEPIRTARWAKEIIDAYRNLGRVIKDTCLDLSKFQNELELRLKKYGDIILEENDEAPYEPIFDALDRFLEIHKILEEHDIDTPNELANVLERAEKETEGQQCIEELEKLDSSF